MDRLHLEAGLFEALAHLVGHHDAAMLAACTAESHSQVTLAFLHIVRQEIQHQLRYPIKELDGLRKLAHKRGYLGVLSGELAELRNKVRIGEKPHIEDHIRVQRHTILESEAQA